jgi:hypothetical protein
MSSQSELPSNTAIKIAFVHWAIRQAEQEVDQNFARLRAVPHDLPISLLELIEGWSKADQLTMLQAQIKKCQNPGRQREEQRLFDYTDREAWALEQFSYPLNVSPAAREMRGRAGASSLPKGLLKRAMTSRMRSLFGRPVDDRGGEVTYLTHVGGATIYTDLDFGSRLCQVRYTQRLLPRVCDSAISLVTGDLALFSVSLMTLAGSGDTKWSYLTQDDIPDAAELLGHVCMQFVDAVPAIVDEARSIVV